MLVLNSLTHLIFLDDTNTTDPNFSKYNFTDNKPKTDCLAVENKYNFAASSDSESPTEPVTLETIAMLRARVIPN